MLLCAIAAKAPRTIEAIEIAMMICCHSAANPPSGPIIVRTRRAMAAIFGATERNAVTGVGAPSYTSGVHM